MGGGGKILSTQQQPTLPPPRWAASKQQVPLPDVFPQEQRGCRNRGSSLVRGEGQYSRAAGKGPSSWSISPRPPWPPSLLIPTGQCGQHTWAPLLWLLFVLGVKEPFQEIGGTSVSEVSCPLANVFITLEKPTSPGFLRGAGPSDSEC